ncbi:UV DNA damage repair endonuclease UvsE [Aliterella atlantica]|uniref:UV damage repair endonuclease UvdE n=1 Tax=Aliterella atlantica CENA595 TaxID=1618023 RepID=A0A0D8ZRL5_9CYAN|nr:UV DNA damage repair endonuclease UvsE [Aliterella atlantica]KJH71365.1 UV damage repair endonuclease UvdE [Aliterella atlantica CENA595]
MRIVQIENTNKKELFEISDRPKLGLVCITHSKEIRYRTVTRTRYLSLNETERQTTLRNIYTDNLSRLDKAIDFCQQHSIELYRVPSGLFPLSDWEDDIGAAVLAELSGELARVGKRSQELGIRIVIHPDQFVVLSSDSEQVLANSIKILTGHAQLFDLLGLARSPWALMNIHGGKSQRIDRLVQVISELPDNIRNRLTFENDEYAYSSKEILEVCQKSGVPMVFDAHHHICREGLETYDEPSVVETFYAARETWQNPAWQLVHISNGQNSFSDRQHSDYITDMPSVYRQAPWIEIEAKAKEEAIAKLEAEWLVGE